MREGASGDNIYWPNFPRGHQAPAVMRAHSSRAGDMNTDQYRSQGFAMINKATLILHTFFDNLKCVIERL